jgi:hypothetical protein
LRGEDGKAYNHPVFNENDNHYCGSGVGHDNGNSEEGNRFIAIASRSRKLGGVRWAAKPGVVGERKGESGK